MPLAEEMQAIAAQHARYGFRQRWLSIPMIDRTGLRGWIPILHLGELVKGGLPGSHMILAEMSEDNVDIRTDFFRELDHRQQGLMTDRFVCRSWWCRLKRYVKRRW